MAEKPAEEEILRAYLKTMRDRDQYWDEIQDILVKNPALRPIYHLTFSLLSGTVFKMCSYIPFHLLRSSLSL